MSQKQLQQNKKPNQPNRQDQQNSRKFENNENGWLTGSVLAEKKSSVAQMLASAQAMFNGLSSARSAEAASYFGNQVMLAMAEQTADRRNEMRSAADILSGEMECEFSENSPQSVVETEAAFSPVSVPAFSADVPTANITQVGELAEQYLT